MLACEGIGHGSALLELCTILKNIGSQKAGASSAMDLAEHTAGLYETELPVKSCQMVASK